MSERGGRVGEGSKRLVIRGWSWALDLKSYGVRPEDKEAEQKQNRGCALLRLAATQCGALPCGARPCSWSQVFYFEGLMVAG